MSSRERIWKRSFPRKRFSWKEPKDFVRFEEAEITARRKWWMIPGLCLLCSVLLMANWFIARLDPLKDPLALPFALAIAIGAPLAMVYGLQPLFALVPSWVDVYETRIVLIRHGLVSHVPFKDIESVDLTNKHGFTALSVARKKSNRWEILIGVAPEVDSKTLTEFFESKGLNRSRRTESLPSAVA